MPDTIKRELALKRYWLKRMTKYCEAAFSKNLVGTKDIEVRAVYYFDKELKKQLTWEKSGDHYALISFNAISKSKLNQLAIDYKNGDYVKLYACNIFLRVSLKEAKDIYPGTKGTLTCDYLDGHLTGHSFVPNNIHTR